MRLSSAGIDASSPDATLNLLPSPVCLQTCAEIWEFCRVYGRSTDGRTPSSIGNEASADPTAGRSASGATAIPMLVSATLSRERFGLFEAAVDAYFCGIEEKIAPADASRGGAPSLPASPPSSPMRDMEELLGPADWSWTRPFMNASLAVYPAACADAFPVGNSSRSSSRSSSNSNARTIAAASSTALKEVRGTLSTPPTTHETLRDVFLASVVYHKPTIGFEWLCRRMVGLPTTPQQQQGSSSATKGTVATSLAGRQEEGTVFRRKTTETLRSLL